MTVDIATCRKPLEASNPYWLIIPGGRCCCGMYISVKEMPTRLGNKHTDELHFCYVNYFKGVTIQKLSWCSHDVSMAARYLPFPAYVQSGINTPWITPHLVAKALHELSQQCTYQGGLYANECIRITNSVAIIISKLHNRLNHPLRLVATHRLKQPSTAFYGLIYGLASL